MTARNAPRRKIILKYAANGSNERAPEKAVSVTPNLFRFRIKPIANPNRASPKRFFLAESFKIESGQRHTTKT